MQEKRKLLYQEKASYIYEAREFFSILENFYSFSMVLFS